MDASRTFRRPPWVARGRQCRRAVTRLHAASAEIRATLVTSRVARASGCAHGEDNFTGQEVPCGDEEGGTSGRQVEDGGANEGQDPVHGSRAFQDAEPSGCAGYAPARPSGACLAGTAARLFRSRPLIPGPAVRGITAPGSRRPNQRAPSEPRPGP